MPKTALEPVSAPKRRLADYDDDEFVGVGELVRAFNLGVNLVPDLKRVGLGVICKKTTKREMRTAIEKLMRESSGTPHESQDTTALDHHANLST